ncbi:hypothetical protein LX97_00214 [Nonlabens dokdonensis]|jgi:hypothetical protein|uniref:Uncharacterized protein n=2 Tax=Nonlabens dokdonensis TaxID=328515 RepID=L7W9F7_NONDD|nr:hypothetical protein [Nonlabens dokdonensis]AGC75518.1 hypothetical protein DDD_0391 [Nonlabens dokdonensis DSW-6]PZX43214.1 hypothetical protein LX97_00214 [Nonlabens dokdonensis]
MNSKKIYALVFIAFVGIRGISQNNATTLPFIEESTCKINFEPTTTVADLELFAKCFVYQSPEVAAQSTIKNDQINFRKLPLLITNGEFPTVQNSFRQPLILFGEYEPEFVNTRTNNLAFFEANRNSVLSAGYSVFLPEPIF